MVKEKKKERERLTDKIGVDRSKSFDSQKEKFIHNLKRDDREPFIFVEEHVEDHNDKEVKCTDVWHVKNVSRIKFMRRISEHYYRSEFSYDKSHEVYDAIVKGFGKLENIDDDIIWDDRFEVKYLSTNMKPIPSHLLSVKVYGVK